MRELTFKEVELFQDSFIGTDDEQIDMYVDGQLAIVNIRSDISEAVSQMEEFHKVDGAEEISKMMLHEIDVEFNLEEDEKIEFLYQITNKIKGKI